LLSKALEILVEYMYSSPSERVEFWTSMEASLEEIISCLLFVKLRKYNFAQNFLTKKEAIYFFLLRFI
jgi:hypothetical protein